MYFIVNRRCLFYSSVVLPAFKMEAKIGGFRKTLRLFIPGIVLLCSPDRLCIPRSCIYFILN